jgi:hypothetical protein
MGPLHSAPFMVHAREQAAYRENQCQGPRRGSRGDRYQLVNRHRSEHRPHLTNSLLIQEKKAYCRPPAALSQLYVTPVPLSAFEVPVKDWAALPVIAIVTPFEILKPGSAGSLHAASAQVAM